MSKFSAQHYNAIAKDFRTAFDSSKACDTRKEEIIYRAALANLALRLAIRFKEDNERFNPHRFLDACSPDVDVYPISELWEDYLKND
jgi:hypothetical protein